MPQQEPGGGTKLSPGIFKQEQPMKIITIILVASAAALISGPTAELPMRPLPAFPANEIWLNYTICAFCAVQFVMAVALAVLIVWDALRSR